MGWAGFWRMPFHGKYSAQNSACCLRDIPVLDVSHHMLTMNMPSFSPQSLCVIPTDSCLISSPLRVCQKSTLNSVAFRKQKLHRSPIQCPEEFQGAKTKPLPKKNKPNQKTTTLAPPPPQKKKLPSLV